MSKNKVYTVLFSIFIILIAVVLFSLFVVNHQRARSTDVADLKVEKLHDINGVRVSGLVMHSALAVREIKFSCSAESVDVDLILAYGSKAPSGSFDFVVFPKPETKFIRFGKDRATIWTK
jgi:hypothetical protein